MTEIPSGEETTGEVSAEPREKCTTQPVLTAALRLRFLSNQIPTDRSTAGTAFLTTGSPERTAIKVRTLLRNYYVYRVLSVLFCLTDRRIDSFSIMIGFKS